MIQRRALLPVALSLSLSLPLSFSPAFALASPGDSAQTPSKQTAARPARAGASSTGKPGTAKAPRTITITGNEDMKYDVTTITAKPGETLHVVLKAVGSMPKVAMAHDFVLLRKGVNPMAFATAAENARDTGFIPPSMRKDVLAFTPLAGAGETVDVTFTAPAERGSYTYLCPFPGHSQSGMKGTLVVK